MKEFLFNWSSESPRHSLRHYLNLITHSSQTLYIIWMNSKTKLITFRKSPIVVVAAFLFNLLKGWLCINNLLSFFFVRKCKMTISLILLDCLLLFIIIFLVLALKTSESRVLIDTEMLWSHMRAIGLFLIQICWSFIHLTSTLLGVRIIFSKCYRVKNWSLLREIWLLLVSILKFLIIVN